MKTEIVLKPGTVSLSLSLSNGSVKEVCTSKPSLKPSSSESGSRGSRSGLGVMVRKLDEAELAERAEQIAIASQVGEDRLALRGSPRTVKSTLRREGSRVSELR